MTAPTQHNTTRQHPKQGHTQSIRCNTTTGYAELMRTSPGAYVTNLDGPAFTNSHGELTWILHDPATQARTHVTQTRKPKPPPEGAAL